MSEHGRHGAPVDEHNIPVFSIEHDRSPARARTEPQILLILVGLPGSGKSTLCEGLLRSNATPNHSDSAQSGPTPIDSSPHSWAASRRQWVRASQDDAPSRRRQECEQVVRQALRDGHNVVVDRCNFDPAQRAHFVNIAYAHVPRPQLWALTLFVPLDSLERRIHLRTTHPTIPDLETGRRVLAQMSRQIRSPTPDGGEGFDRLFVLYENQQPVVWTPQAIGAILRDIEVYGLRPSAQKGEDGWGVRSGHVPRAPQSVHMAHGHA